MTLPTFVVAGTQKAATTWLYECLNEHPEVFVPTTKELHHFCEAADCRLSTRAQGDAYYLGQFDGAGPQHRAVGELTIDYMYFPYIAADLQRINPAMKVIFILREPVERAYSAYWMVRRGRIEFAPFEDFLNPDNHIVGRGFYYRQIENFRRLFPDSQLKILIYEDIQRNPQAFVAEVFRFLGVDDRFVPPSLRQQIGETRVMSPRMSTLFYRRLSPLLQVPPVLAAWRLFKRVTGYKRAKPSAASSGGIQHHYPPLPADQRRRLENLYRDDTERLFGLIGRRVGDWTHQAEPGE